MQYACCVYVCAFDCNANMHLIVIVIPKVQMYNSYKIVVAAVVIVSGGMY